MSSRLADPRLTIADLLHRLADLESAREPMNPLLYRIVAQQLQALASDWPDAALAGCFGTLNPLVGEMLANRFFDAHGLLPGSGAAASRATARQLLRRLGVPTPPPVRHP